MGTIGLKMTFDLFATTTRQLNKHHRAIFVYFIRIRRPSHVVQYVLAGLCSLIFLSISWGRVAYTIANVRVAAVEI